MKRKITQQRLSNGSLWATYTNQSICLSNGKPDTPTQNFNSSQEKTHLAAGNLQKRPHHFGNIGGTFPCAVRGSMIRCHLSLNEFEIGTQGLSSLPNMYQITTITTVNGIVRAQ